MARPTRSGQPRTCTRNPTILDKYNEILLTGECGTVDDETLPKYICTDSRELDWFATSIWFDLEVGPK